MPIPKTLRRWMDKHPGVVQDVDWGSGYNTPTGFAYNVLLSPGHHAYGDAVHCIIEETVTETISELNSVQKFTCPDC